MRMRLKQLFGGVRGQIVLLILASILATHLVMTIAFRLEQRGGFTPHPAELTGQQAALIRLIDAAAPAGRVALLEQLRAVYPELDLSLPEESGGILGEDAHDPLQRLLGSGFHVETRRAPEGAVTRVGLPNGGIVRFRHMPPGPPPLGGGAMILAVLLLIAIGLFGGWAAYALTKPLRAIARNAAAWSLDGAPIAIPEHGPEEVRAVAAALAQMQTRISRLAESRTRMLAAVSHDLRTPITRLRLRAEFLPDDDERRRMLRDLEQMEQLVQGALTHLRDGRTGEEAVPVDLPSLINMIVDEFADAGQEVSTTLVPAPALRVRPRELARALTNLIDNALKHGGNAHVRLEAGEHGARICIDDDGPGMDAALLQNAFEPFVRGDAARSLSDGGGFGLGLSIARAIIEAHGGMLSLLPRPQGGLRAQVELPFTGA